MLIQKKQLIIYKFFSLLLVSSSFLEASTLSEYEKNIKNSYSLRSAVEKHSNKNLEKNLRDFVAASRPNRVTGSVGAQKAQVYIEDYLNTHKGTNVSVITQEFMTSKNVKAVNFIWKKEGIDKNKKRLILMAHYDTILKDKEKIISQGSMPGADNNASSISVLFGMVELFNQLDLPKTIEVVFLDAHEQNFAGVKVYQKVASLNPKEDFIINLSKLGHDSKKDDKLSKFNNIALYLYTESTKSEQDFAQSFIETAHKNYPQLLISQRQQGQIQNADPIDYLWSQKIPGIMLSQDRENDLNPRLYSSNDFVETLNFNTLFFVYKAVTSSVLALNYDIVK